MPGGLALPWAEILRRADKAAPGFRKAFLAAVAQAQKGASVSTLRTYLSKRQYDKAAGYLEAAWGDAQTGLETELGKQTLALMGDVGQAGAQALVAGGSFELLNPAAIAWAKAQSSALVTGVTAQQRAAIRAVIGEASSGALTVDGAAGALRQVVGLDTRRAAALAAYRGRMQAAAESAIAARPSLPAVRKAAIRAKADLRAEAYRRRLLASRTETIARTETSAAANEGLVQAWRQAEQAGKFPLGLAKRWVTTPDDRRCPICAAMQGRVASIGTPFDVPSLGAMQRPPAHPNCRCTITLVRPTKGQLRRVPQLEGVQSFKSVGSAGGWTAKGPMFPSLAQAAIAPPPSPLGYAVKGPYKTKASAQSMISHKKVPPGTTPHVIPGTGQWELHVPTTPLVEGAPSELAAPTILPTPPPVAAPPSMAGQFFVKAHAEDKAAKLAAKTGKTYAVEPAPPSSFGYQWQVVEQTPIPIPATPGVPTPPPGLATPQAVVVPPPAPIPPVAAEPAYVLKGPYKTKESAKSIISHKQAPAGSTVHPVPGGTTWEIHVPVPSGSSWMEAASQAHPSKTVAQLEELLAKQQAGGEAKAVLQAAVGPAPLSPKGAAVLFDVQHGSAAELLAATLDAEQQAALKAIRAGIDDGWWSASDAMKAAIDQKLKAIASWEAGPVSPLTGLPSALSQKPIATMTLEELQQVAAQTTSAAVKAEAQKAIAEIEGLLAQAPAGGEVIGSFFSPQYAKDLAFNLNKGPKGKAWVYSAVEKPGAGGQSSSWQVVKTPKVALAEPLPDIAATTAPAPSLAAAATPTAPPIAAQPAPFVVKGPYKNKVSALSAKSKQKLAGATAHEIPGGTTWELHVPTGSPAAQAVQAGAAPPVVPYAPSAFRPTTPWVDDLMSRKIAAASGSNPGGLFADAQGRKYYVKQYKDAKQAYSEALSNRIYRELGAGAPESYVAQTGSGQTVFVSRWLDDVTGTVGNAGLDAKTADQILDHFVADVFTANWDAVGTGLDNVVRLANGTIARIDQGGSLLFRAQGAAKPAAALTQIGEWESFLTKNAYYRQVFEKAGLSSADELGARAIAQIDRLEGLTRAPGFSWRRYVEERLADLPAAAAKTATAKDVEQMLGARFRLLLKKRDELKEAARVAALPIPPAPPVPVAKLLAFDDAVGLTRTRPGAGGFVSWDAGDVEDLAVHLRGVKIGNADWTEIKYKLTDAAGKALRLKADAGAGGFASGSLRVVRQSLAPTPGARAVVGEGEASLFDHFGSSGRTFSIRRPNLQVDFHVSTSSESGPFALHNTVQVFVRGEPSEAQVRSILAEFGVRASRAAEQADFAALAENKLARLFQIGVADLTPAERAKALARAKTLGIGPADVRIGADEFGRPQAELTDAALARIVAKTKTTHFVHSLSSGASSADSVVAKLWGDHHGLVATMRRFTEGVGHTGSSSVSDVSSGGADYIFTRQRAGDVAAKTFRGGEVVIRPSAMRRLDWFSYAGDNYGAQRASYSSAVRTRDNLANVAQHDGSAETMFKGRVSWNDVEAVYVSDATVRAQTIAKLRARGITEIGGQALERFIRVSGERLR